VETYSAQQLNEIVQGFRDRTLEKSLFTHEAHIITAIWHLMEFDKEDALCRLRAGIISYNISVGGENTGQSGYHETITIFWWEVIAQYLEKYPDGSFAGVCTAFLQSPMADKGFPFRFYTKGKLLSSAARAKFMAPDLQEISIK
jgi:hypothetical protein